MYVLVNYTKSSRVARCLVEMRKWLNEIGDSILLFHIFYKLDCFVHCSEIILESRWDTTVVVVLFPLRYCLFFTLAQ